jgi:tryptophan-rich sensory protein
MLSKSTQLFGLVCWLLVSFVAAAIGAAASIQAANFYAQLQQPFWAPPAQVFGPVWSCLYLLMGIAAWLVWREEKKPSKRAALALFVIQLGFNALWSWLFFRWHLGALAFADVLLLLALILATLMSFWRIRPLAGALLLPYLLWVSFATALNYAVWQLNPQIL